jgi:thermostable 8-oxoguanine DNA glycosylase
VYEGNLQIDTPDNEWTPDAVERLFIFCQLDRVMPYDKVMNSYLFLESEGLVSFESLRKFMPEELAPLLREAKLRFPETTANYLYYNVHHFDGKTLHKMSRDKIVEKCRGFGWKLASMFCNRCQGTQYAIIDVHIDRFLQEHGCTSKKYHEKETFFVELARQRGITPDELDWEIWNNSRIGNKKEEKHVAV